MFPFRTSSLGSKGSEGSRASGDLLVGRARHAVPNNSSGSLSCTSSQSCSSPSNRTSSSQQLSLQVNFDGSNHGATPGAPRSPSLASWGTLTPPASPGFSFFRPALLSSSRQCSEEATDTEKQQDASSCRNLEALLGLREFREELVNTLLSDYNGEIVRKIRFFTAINEVVRTVDKSERIFKAGKVVETFVKPTSRFYVANIVPPRLQSDVSRLKMRAFQAMGQVLILELLKSKAVLDSMQKAIDDGMLD